MTTQAPAGGMRIARLARRGVIAVGGPDAEKFLNDLVTADILGAGPNRAAYAGLLTPQGKLLFDFIVFRDGDVFLVDVRREKVTELAKRLGMYRLRAKVTVEERPATSVYALWGAAASVAPPVAVPEPRLPELGWRVITTDELPTNASEADYDAHRIALGVPEGGIDFAFGEAFPHDADMDQLGGVDFTKGCYVGQEVVSRMQHRHTARRRVITATVDGTAPPGTEITADGKPVGTLASVSGGQGLALVRLDRVKDAMDRGVAIVAGGVPVTLSIPPWAKFGWPSTATAGEG